MGDSLEQLGGREESSQLLLPEKAMSLVVVVVVAKDCSWSNRLKKGGYFFIYLCGKR